ncbi:MAG: RyR domain-containing protein [bacterium]
MSNPDIVKSIQNLLDQIKSGHRDSEIYFEIGKQYGALGKIYESLLAYACGINYTGKPDGIRAALEEYQEASGIVGSDCPKKLLMLALAAKFPDPPSLRNINEFGTKGERKLDNSVAIIVDSALDIQHFADHTNRDDLLEGFKDYFGTMIGGGTETSIGAICGEIQAAHPKRVLSVAYFPENLPGEIKPDTRFKEHRSVPDEPFMFRKPLQYWADILGSGCRPENVKVLGFSIAPDAILEYILAIAFGASVVMFQEFEKPVSERIDDPLYLLLENTVYYPHYPYVLRCYIGTGLPSFPLPMREIVAKAVHETYRIMRSPFQSEQSMAEWDDLSSEMKQSNLKSVDHVVQKFNEIGLKLELVEGSEIMPADLSIDQVETLASMEHARWISERLLSGWMYGEKKDFEKKTDPSIIPWSELTDEIQEIDRALVRKLPVFLGHFDLELRKFDFNPM